MYLSNDMLLSYLEKRLVSYMYLKILNASYFLMWRMLEFGKITQTQDKHMLNTDEVIIFVPCATHGHRMIHKQMKHVSYMR